MKLSNIIDDLIQPIHKTSWKEDMIFPSQILWPYSLTKYEACFSPNFFKDLFKEYLYISIKSNNSICVSYLYEEDQEDPLDYFWDEDIALYKFEKENDEGFVYRLLKSKDY